jgi:uncharacterized protein YndB with AHSA1/START domain
VVMKILKILATLIALLVIVLALSYLILGFTLPDETVVKTEFDVAAPPEKVWQALTDQEKYPEWAPNVVKVDVVSENEWREWIENSKEPLLFTAIDKQQPNHMEAKYAMGDFFEGHWKGDIAAAAGGAHVTAEDRIRVKSWAAKIMMYPFFDLKEFVNKWNRKLKERAESLK